MGAYRFIQVIAAVGVAVVFVLGSFCQLRAEWRWEMVDWLLIVGEFRGIQKEIARLPTIG